MRGKPQVSGHRDGQEGQMHCGPTRQGATTTLCAAFWCPQPPLPPGAADWLSHPRRPCCRPGPWALRGVGRPPPGCPGGHLAPRGHRALPLLFSCWLSAILILMCMAIRGSVCLPFMYVKSFFHVWKFSGNRFLFWFVLFFKHPLCCLL